MTDRSSMEYLINSNTRNIKWAVDQTGFKTIKFEFEGHKTRSVTKSAYSFYLLSVKPIAPMSSEDMTKDIKQLENNLYIQVLQNFLKHCNDFYLVVELQADGILIIKEKEEDQTLSVLNILGGYDAVFSSIAAATSTSHKDVAISTSVNAFIEALPQNVKTKLLSLK